MGNIIPDLNNALANLKISFEAKARDFRDEATRIRGSMTEGTRIFAEADRQAITKAESAALQWDRHAEAAGRGYLLHDSGYAYADSTFASGGRAVYAEAIRQGRVEYVDRTSRADVKGLPITDVPDNNTPSKSGIDSPLGVS